MGKIKPLYENMQACFVITSDNHIDSKHPFPRIPMSFLRRSLKDAENAEIPVDAYITVGDTTSRGNETNWEMAKKCFADCKPAKQIMLTIGNHDTWNDDGYEAAIEQYLKSACEISGRKQDKTYFSAVINGCKLIFLGTTSDSGCAAVLGGEQLSWLGRELEHAPEGKPVFVFCHQSLNGRHGLPRTWDKQEKPDRAPDEGGIGDESEQLADILKSHKNVFYFSGHSHMGLCGENMKEKEGYASFEKEDGLELINLPSLACGNHHGETDKMGIGVVVEVYAGRVVIRPRSFSRRRMNKKIIIRDRKPYLEVKLI
ncbi:MAG: hypothetical protein GX051_06980 [Clostridiales bacterium]|nr:hypothetical protein [Clostridiales bacterium]